MAFEKLQGHLGLEQLNPNRLIVTSQSTINSPYYIAVTIQMNSQDYNNSTVSYSTGDGGNCTCNGLNLPSRFQGVLSSIKPIKNRLQCEYCRRKNYAAATVQQQTFDPAAPVPLTPYGQNHGGQPYQQPPLPNAPVTYSQYSAPIPPYPPQGYASGYGGSPLGSGHGSCPGTTLSPSGQPSIIAYANQPYQAQAFGQPGEFDWPTGIPPKSYADHLAVRVKPQSATFQQPNQQYHDQAPLQPGYVQSQMGTYNSGFQQDAHTTWGWDTTAMPLLLLPRTDLLPHPVLHTAARIPVIRQIEVTKPLRLINWLWT
ncbi:hypothetical protein QFC20_006326 [Naganishia adeliensis]|uniref:Uncharacterized protein n=1 Tax=Naganishia adeliensis TaxID=92952 RepID=A0ACC2VD03_9TREE|nr:hypothetical protein QFC20_006326 [Naganishia adeliensis]